MFVTDPRRTPDPVAVAARLPRGAGVIHRGFGRPAARAEARALSALARRRGLVLLIGGDPDLADAVEASGVHLPERLLHQAPRLLAGRPQWLVTGAAHSRAALRRAERFGVHAAVVSPVFPSRSPSAGRPLGPTRFAAWVREARTPVLALGGVDARTVRRLMGTGAAGFAAVEAFAPGEVRT